MSVENYANVTNLPFVLNGEPLTKEAETVLQDAARSGAMVKHTAMSYNPTSKKWVPFSDETATDGTQMPTGILMATLSEAQIKAGDVVNIPIIVGGNKVVLDASQLVIENSKTLDTIVNVPANLNKSVEQLFAWSSIYFAATTPIEEFENAPV